MRHRWGVLCERSIVEKDSGLLTLVGILERLNVADVIAGGERTTIEDEVKKHGLVPLPVNMELISYWTRSDRSAPEVGEYRTSLYGPNGKMIGKPAAAVDIDLTGSVFNRRTILRMREFPCVGFGRYRIVISGRVKGAARWRKYDELPFEIAPLEPPEEPKAPEQ